MPFNKQNKIKTYNINKSVWSLNEKTQNSLAFEFSMFSFHFVKLYLQTSSIAMFVALWICFTLNFSQHCLQRIKQRARRFLLSFVCPKRSKRLHEFRNENALARDVNGVWDEEWVWVREKEEESTGELNEQSKRDHKTELCAYFLMDIIQFIASVLFVNLRLFRSIFSVNENAPLRNSR